MPSLKSVTHVSLPQNKNYYDVHDLRIWNNTHYTQSWYSVIVPHLTLHATQNRCPVYYIGVLTLKNPRQRQTVFLASIIYKNSINVRDYLGWVAPFCRTGFFLVSDRNQSPTWKCQLRQLSVQIQNIKKPTILCRNSLVKRDRNNRTVCCNANIQKYT